MALSLVTPPSEEPVSIDEVRAHLRLEDGDDTENTLLLGLIKAARRRVEVILRRQIVTATYDLFLDEFPNRFWRADHWGPGEATPRQGDDLGGILGTHAIVIPRPPLQSITSVSYLDNDGNSQVIDSSDYDVDTNSEPSRIVPRPEFAWPVPGIFPNAVTVRFMAGYGDASSVPEEIKLAIKFLVHHWYENRSETTNVRLEQTPVGVASILDSVRWGSYV